MKIEDKTKLLTIIMGVIFFVLAIVFLIAASKRAEEVIPGSEQLIRPLEFLLLLLIFARISSEIFYFKRKRSK